MKSKIYSMKYFLLAPSLSWITNPYRKVLQNVFKITIYPFITCLSPWNKKWNRIYDKILCQRIKKRNRQERSSSSQKTISF